MARSRSIWTTLTILCLLLSGLTAQEKGSTDQEKTTREKAASEKAATELAAREAAAEKLWNRAQAKLTAAAQAKTAHKKKAQQQLVLDAIALFERIVKIGKGTRFYGIAHYNSASLLRTHFRGRRDEAIERFKALIKSDVDDKESSGNLMRPFRNYRYHAWREISGVHRNKGRMREAVVTLFSMRKAYVTHCGNCYSGMEKGFYTRLDEIGIELIHGECLKGKPKATLTTDRKLLRELAKKHRSGKGFVAVLRKERELFDDSVRPAKRQGR